MEKIHIVIPVFNGWKQTRLCLDALRTSVYKDLEIIVVDHGSTDETKALLPTLYPEVIHILGDHGLWWAGATNLGVRESMRRGAQWIMLLNNDCYVTPETIEHLVEHMRDSGDAIVAPVQKDFLTHRVLFITATTCFLLGFSTFLFPGKGRRVLGKRRLLPTKLILGGRGALIPRGIFERLGLFDEIRLPHAGADHDFYLRCRKARIALFVAADAEVYVDDSRTTLAAKIGEEGLKPFLRTLIDRRSHRNIRDLTTLFKLHYPIPGLHHVGVVLNLLRYVTVYGGRRLRRLLGEPLHRD